MIKKKQLPFLSTFLSFKAISQPLYQSVHTTNPRSSKRLNDVPEFTRNGETTMLSMPQICATPFTCISSSDSHYNPKR